jgi:GT2 family glycosyltransferase
MLKLSIIITSKNRKGDLFTCVKSVLASSFSDFEIIVVDDFSNDGTEKLTKADFNYENIEIYHQNKTLYMAEARNFGAKKAKGEYLLFIDDDNIIDQKMVKNLVEFADTHSEYGILGPRMFYLADRKEYMSFQKINLYTGKTTGHIDSHHYLINDSEGIPNVFLIKKRVFEKCGYFDNQLLQTFSEPDLAFRAKNFGYKCGIYRDAVTYHNVSRSDNTAVRGLGGNFPTKAYCLMRNRIIFIWRYANGIQKAVFLLFFSWIYPLIYSLMTLRFKRFDLIRLYWLGMRDGVAYIFTKKVINST